jgi:hypothetical protein
MKDEQKKDTNPIYNISWLIIGGLFNIFFGTGTFIFGLGTHITLAIIAGALFIVVGVGMLILGPLMFKFLKNPNRKE